jgi:hypothetical protein
VIVRGASRDERNGHEEQLPPRQLPGVVELNGRLQRKDALDADNQERNVARDVVRVRNAAAQSALVSEVVVFDRLVHFG